MIRQPIEAVATTAEAEKWAKTRFIARLIPDEVDLSRPCRVALALLEAGCLCRDFVEIFDDAMAVALANRLAEQRDGR